jgi:hypothetical protein
MNSEIYRRKAYYYLTCARRMIDPNARAALIELAAHWKQMAEATERPFQLTEQIQPAE